MWFKVRSVVCKLRFTESVRIRRFASFNGFENLKIVDLTRIVAGPYCTMILGDLGAQVFKIESPGIGDECRNWPPHINNDEEEITSYFASINRNKKSISVNLKSPEGRKIVRDLSVISDVLVENYLPGKLSKFGLGYEDLNDAAPQLVYCSITGFGQSGPYRDRPGYDVIAASIGGLLSITGYPDRPPCKPGVALTDIATGLYANGAILAALLHRSITGCGQHISCDLLSTQLATLINIGSNYLNSGKEGECHGSAHESIVPYEAFKTKTGYITVGAGSNTHFVSLCKLIGIPHIATDDRFTTNLLRVKNRQVLISLLIEIFEKKSTTDWMKILHGAPFPCGPVNKISEDVPVLTLRVSKPKNSKQVKWTEGTVDNEHLNRRKSKCCCIYEKPKAFGESSSESDGDECENCFGHVEKKKKNRKNKQPDGPSNQLQDPQQDPLPTDAG